MLDEPQNKQIVLRQLPEELPQGNYSENREGRIHTANKEQCIWVFNLLIDLL